MSGNGNKGTGGGIDLRKTSFCDEKNGEKGKCRMN